jgi:flavodoxin
MKQAVLYFTISGHCANVARRISESEGADLIEIVPVKRYSGWMSYVICGYQVSFRKAVKLKKVSQDLRQYDKLTVVSPVHAGKVSAAVRSFLFQNRSHYNDVKLVLCHADPKETFESAKTRLENELMFTFSGFESLAD